MNIITSTSAQPYNEWVVEALNRFEKYHVKGIAIVALTDENYTLTGYWNMTLHDKICAKEEINFDTIDEFVKNNAERYGFAAEDEGEELDDE